MTGWVEALKVCCFSNF